MNDIVKEIQQEAAEEKLQAFFIKNGQKLVIGAVAVVIFTAAYSFYGKYQDKKSAELGSQFTSAMETNLPEDYDKIIAANNKAYSPMAALVKSGILNNKEKYAEAITELDKIINSKNYDKAFVHIAMLDKAYLLIKNNGDEKAITSIFEEITAPDAPFKASALELNAYYLLSKGNKQQGIEILKKLAADKEIPETLQNRARNALGTMEVK